MKTRLAGIIIMVILFTVACEFRKSIGKDLVTGITTKGDGLSCEDVYLSDGKERISRHTFVYGEKFYVNFSDISGFRKVDGNSFPGMELFIVSQQGDTILRRNDMYSDYADGMDFSPLLLHANLTVADPMHSGDTYTLSIKIWDKNGEGTFRANMDFTVLMNHNIVVETSGVSFDEIYLFSDESKAVITDNIAKFNEEVYLIFEGLEGFRTEEGRAFPGLSIVAKDAAGEVILNEPDLVSASGIDAAQLKLRIAPHVVFKDADIKNPVRCKIVIWDKKGKNRISASTEIKLN